jgi:hypothetical protein
VSDRVVVDGEFQALLRPLAEDEFRFLEEKILEEGFRVPLVVWEEEGILLDGHNRLEICRAHNIEYTIQGINLPDRNAAKDWIDKNQLAHRNLAPGEFILVIGRLYNRQKKAHGGDRRSSPQNEDMKTSERLASDHGVSRATVERAGRLAADVESLKDVAPDVEDRFLSGEVTRETIHEASRVPAEEAREILNKPHVAHNAGDNEWYTPKDLIRRGRVVMGAIDLDPASSVEANEVVMATKIFTEGDNALEQPWHGCVWMNPPYATGLIGKFCTKSKPAS